MTTNQENTTVTLPISAAQGQPLPSLSDRYGFVDTSKIIDLFAAHDYLVTQSNALKARERDPRTVRHLVRMRHAEHAMAVNGTVPEIIMINSHDGSSSLRFMAGLFRLVCSNGLIVQSAQLAPTISLRHSVDAPALALQAAATTLERAIHSTQRITAFQQRMLTQAEQLDFATRANQLWTGRVQPQALLEMRRSEDGGDDLWRVFNRVQENLTMGGLVGRSATGRRTRTHGIRAMDNSVRVNRQLWALAEEFAA